MNDDLQRKRLRQRRHVIFSDSVGLDLELVHTVQNSKNNNNSKTNEESVTDFIRTIDNKNESRLLSSLSSSSSITSSSSSSSSIGKIYTTTDENNYYSRISSAPHVKKRGEGGEDSGCGSKIILPKFVLSPDKSYEKLIKNGICLNSVEIYNQSRSIRGIILTLSNSDINNHNHDTNNETKNENTRNSNFLVKKIKKWLGHFHHLPTVIKTAYTKYNNKCISNNNKTAHISSPKKEAHNHHFYLDRLDGKRQRQQVKLDLVYVIWSVDKFKTWKYHASIQRNCKMVNSNNYNDSNNNNNSSNTNDIDSNGSNDLIKTHEFFIQNVDQMLELGQTIQIIVCHQTGATVFRDTNQERCYNFDCAFKI